MGLQDKQDSLDIGDHEVHTAAEQDIKRRRSTHGATGRAWCYVVLQVLMSLKISADPEGDCSNFSNEAHYKMHACASRIPYQPPSLSMSGLATHMSSDTFVRDDTHVCLSPHPSHILIALPPSRRWGFVTDSTGATMMRIPVSTGGVSLQNNTAYDIIFSAVNSDTNSKLVVAETFTRDDLMDGCFNIYLGTSLKPGIYTVSATLNDAFPGLPPVEALLNHRSALGVECCPKNEDSHIRRGRATVDVPPPGSVQVAADSHLGSRRLRGKARDTSNSTAGGSEALWQRNDSAWAAALIQFYNEASYNMHRLNLLGWDLHAYDADAGAPDKA